MRLMAAAAALAAFVFADGAVAAERPRCGVPDYLLFGESPLKRVSSVVETQKRLRIAVVGTGSSALAGPDGPPSVYPSRLAAGAGPPPSPPVGHGGPLPPRRAAGRERSDGL